jgi:hypothetical protein
MQDRRAPDCAALHQDYLLKNNPMQSRRPSTPSPVFGEGGVGFLFACLLDRP